MEFLKHNFEKEPLNPRIGKVIDDSAQGDGESSPEASAAAIRVESGREIRSDDFLFIQHLILEREKNLKIEISKLVTSLHDRNAVNTRNAEQKLDELKKEARYVDMLITKYIDNK